MEHAEEADLRAQMPRIACDLEQRGGTRMILETTRRFMAERMKAIIKTTNADHLPALTMPKPVIDIVLEAATSTLAG
ncbi:hypothetical protein HDF16_005235 [Granulicella aggregans]|uniref:Uncharacterized protein n=1 Tax=Granulicella aggregans TaxID=474949 RepID=A0A7W8E6M8_9BACT|nr:hypothetical protein [Granulicella aggregans]MBB5060499.1 hypothetical protein [Granulicella aggregans]